MPSVRGFSDIFGNLKKFKEKKPSTSEQKKINTGEQKKQYDELLKLFKEALDYFHKYLQTNKSVSLTDNEITSGKKLSCALNAISTNIQKGNYNDDCNYNEQINMLKDAFDEFKQALSEEIK